ncbi:MAG: glycosyltransferase family 4 protein [Prevotellaceae bacterium]|nr:glycosyltransferase family 4 protein [Prevotellaceae bacterium]
MKVAFLLGSLNRGGTETLLLDVFRNADKADFEFIGVHRKGGVLQQDFYTAEPKFFKLAPKFPFDFIYLLKLRKLLKKENVQIVHSQQFLDALYSKIATLGTKIKVVQTYHSFEKESVLMKFIIKKTDKNFFVSNYQREYYIKKYSLKPEKQATVYNGISFKKFDKNFEKPVFLSENKNPKLAMIGNFVSVREHFTVCRFLKLLNEKTKKIEFYFIGKKDEKNPHLYDECADFCAKNGLQNVHFLGSRNDVPAILQHIDAFIYSTDHDTFGIAVIEAIAAGLPVFVNDFEVMKEIADNGKFAILYKTKNETDLLDKFLLFLQNQNEYKENAKKNAIEIRKKFSIEEHLKVLERNYFKLKNKN